MNYDNLPTDDLKEFGIIGADFQMMIFRNFQKEKASWLIMEKTGLYFS